MFMEEKACIEAWNGPVMEGVFLKLPARVRAPITNKIKYYQNYTVSQLKNNRKYLEKIEGVNYGFVLWELKFPSDPPYRCICVIKEHSIIMLEMFQGSGSDGKVTKRVPRAVKKANEWYQSANQ